MQRDAREPALEEQVEALKRLSTLAAAPLTRGELLERILDVVLEIVGAEAGSLVLADAETGELRFECATGPRAAEVEGVALEPGEGVVGWVISHNEPVVVPEVTTDERFSPRVDDLVGFRTQSLAVCPLAIPDRVIGALELVNKRDGSAFGEAEIGVLTAAAPIAALAVENHRLRAWAERKLGELTTLVEVERQLNSTLDRRALLRSIVESAVQVAGGEAGSLLLVDAEVGDLYFEVATGPIGQEIKAYRVPPGRGVVGWVVENRQPLLVKDATKDPRFDPLIAKSLGFQTRSLVAVPMILRGNVVGVIEVVNLPSRIADDQEYLSVMTGFADQAASALERARLYRELEERVESTEDELREAYATLSVEKRKSDAMIESVADGILVVDPGGTVVLANRAAERFLGFPADAQAEGLALAELPDSEALGSLFEQAVQRPREIVAGEVELAEVELHVNATQVLDDEGRPLGTVGVLTDISHLKELSRLKTELISIVSHELRSPLTSLKAVAATLLQSPDLDEATEAEFLGIIDDQCNRMNRMVANLLNASRIEMGRELDMIWEEVDLPDLVERTVAAMRLPAANHHLRVSVPEDCPPIRADADKLRQVLTNLVDNAIKYSEPGTTIAVTVEDRGETLAVAVADEGPGIPQSEQPKLFEMYERTDTKQTRSTAGTGVGLYLVKHLVEAHGGAISVDSKVGRGSTFIVVLPRSTDDNAPAGEA